MERFLLACDPGENGAVAIFDNCKFLCVIPNAKWRDIVHLEIYPACAVIEHNHGIQGQAASSTYNQGFNAGLMFRLMELMAQRVEKCIPQRWMSAFGVPKGMEKNERKKWIQKKVGLVTGEALPLWATDAVALGWTYIQGNK